MKDDAGLSDLRPDPTRDVAGWPEARERIHAEVVASRRSGGGRRVLAATAALVLALPLVWWGLSHRPDATPAPGGTVQPSPTRAAPSPRQTLPSQVRRIQGVGLLQQKPGQATVLCVGAIGASLPSACSMTIPVDGVDWATVPHASEHNGTKEASVQVTGRWDGTTLQVDGLARPGGDTTGPIVFGPLCDNPSGTPPTGTDVADQDAPAGVESLPGFQAMWVTDAGTVRQVWHVAVTQDVAGAESRIRRSFAGPLCVGTIPGPTAAELEAAAQRVMGVRDDPNVRLLSLGPGLRPGAEPVNGLDVRVFLATDEVRRVLENAVGPDVAPWLVIEGQFAVIG